MEKPRLLRVLVAIVVFVGILSMAYAGLIPFVLVAGWSKGVTLSFDVLGPDFAGAEALLFAAGVVPLIIAWGLTHLRPWAWFAGLCYLVVVPIAGLASNIESIVGAPFNAQAQVLQFSIVTGGDRVSSGFDHGTAVAIVGGAYVLAIGCLFSPWVLRAFLKQSRSAVATVDEESTPLMLRPFAAVFAVVAFIQFAIVLGGAWLLLALASAVGLGHFDVAAFALLWIWLLVSAIAELAVWLRSTSLDHPGTVVPIVGALVIAAGALLGWACGSITAPILALAIGAVILNWWHAQWWESTEPTLEEVRARWQERGLL